MAPPEDESRRDDEDPLGSFDLEPAASGEALADLPMRTSESPDEAESMEPSALATESRASVADALRAQLQKNEQALDSTVSDVTQLKTDVAALRSEVAALAGSLNDIGRRVRQQSAPGVVSRLAPIVPAARARSYGIAAVGLAIVMVAGVAAWQRRSPSPASETPPSAVADSTGSSPSSAASATAPSNITAAAVQSPGPPVETELPERRQDARPIYVGTLRVQTEPPGATVLINRKPIGTTPFRAPFRAGSHLIWLERDGYRRWTRVVAVPADQVTTITATLLPDR